MMLLWTVQTYACRLAGACLIMSHFPAKGSGTPASGLCVITCENAQSGWLVEPIVRWKGRNPEILNRDTWLSA